MTDLIGVWCSLYAHAGRQIVAQQFVSAECAACFAKARWLVPVGFLEAVLCEACDEPHAADVLSIDGEVRGICRRTGEAFPISERGLLYRVDAEAFARSLSSALQLEDRARLVGGLENVWKLGARRLNEARIVFFLTPDLGRIDRANTILEAIASQSRSSAFCVIVAGEVDAVQLLQRKGAVIRLRDISSIDIKGTMTIDGDQLLVGNFPGINKPRQRGRPAEQRERILQLFDDAANKNSPIDDSNESLREWGARYEDHFKERRPAPGTIREAIKVWNAQRGS